MIAWGVGFISTEAGKAVTDHLLDDTKRYSKIPVRPSPSEEDSLVLRYSVFHMAGEGTAS